MRIHRASASPPTDVNAALLRTRATAALRAFNVGEYALDVWLADEARMRSLNAEHRGKDYATDVLSFPFAHDHLDLSSISRPGILPTPKSRGDARLGDVAVGLSAARTAAVAKARPLFGPAAGASAAPHGCYGRLYAFQEMPVCVNEACWLLLVHGICHLLGYTHENEVDTATMVDAEEFALRAAISVGSQLRARGQQGGVACITDTDTRTQV